MKRYTLADKVLYTNGRIQRTIVLIDHAESEISRLKHQIKAWEREMQNYKKLLTDKK